MSLAAFGIVSGVIALAGMVPYIVDIIRGNTKPQRAAFLLFTISGFIAFLGQLAEGAIYSLFFAGALMSTSLLTFILSFKFGVGGFGRRDKIGLFLVGCILAAWFLTGSAALAVVLIVIFNTIAKILVMFKVYQLPHTELLYTWIMSTISSLFAVLSVGSLDWILLLSPLQNGITVGLIALIIFVRRRFIPA